jgi:phage gpG-like protein
VAAELIGFGGSLRNFKEPLNEAVREVVIPSIRKNFDVEGRPPWEPLSDVAFIMRDYYGFDSGPILDRTGKLRATATSPGIWTIGYNEAAVRHFPLWYGLLQQEGNDYDLPSRPFMLLQPEDEAAIEDIFVKWIRKKMLTFGFH